MNFTEFGQSRFENSLATVSGFKKNTKMYGSANRAATPVMATAAKIQRTVSIRQTYQLAGSVQMWNFSQATGELLHDGVFEGTGYSGIGTRRNDPDAQAFPGIGPIPRGGYTIGPAYTHPHLGPVVMNLDPQPGTDTFGRDLFRIHGDNARHDASHGCVILGPAIRKLIAESDDRTLEVTA